jgi:hypothetical protein
MELLTIDLTGFDWLLYTLAIALPVWLRYGKRSEKPITLEDVKSQISDRVASGFFWSHSGKALTGIQQALDWQEQEITKALMVPSLAKPEVNLTLTSDMATSKYESNLGSLKSIFGMPVIVDPDIPEGIWFICDGKPKSRSQPMAIAPESSITVRTEPNALTPTDDLEQLTVRQLRALCKMQGYTRYSKMSKHELILTLCGLNR